MTLDEARLKTLTPEQKRRLLQAALTNRRRAAAGVDATPGERASPAERWVRPLAGRPAARRRLVCFPHGGAGATSFRAWPDLLPPDIEPLVVCLPGRDDRASEPFATSLGAAADAIAQALAPLLDRPYLLYGHSLGGALAFATALAIGDCGLRLPEVIVVAAVAPPGLHTGVEPAESSEEPCLSAAAGVDVRRLMEDSGLCDQLRARARADEALFADWSARAVNAVNSPILALAGRDDGRLAPSAMAGWAACTESTFELHTVPGPHLFHLHDPAAVIERVCHAVGSRLARSGLGAPAAIPRRTDGLGLSLFFFSAAEGEDDIDKYRLFDAAVQFADRAGFEGVWIPERHFHPVGGLFPNPSVLAAAVAASTHHLRIRSGSVVLPLHDPVRVAEEWAMVDNLSGGRVDIGVVPGWNPSDYVLAPGTYANRWACVFEHLDVVRRLWRGESIPRFNGAGEEILLRSHPRPLQRELPIWVATSANEASFVRAGDLGVNVLTALLIQPVETFGRNVEMYRAARARAGHDPAAGTVTLMVHTCVGETDTAVRRVVREPFLSYMRSVQSLWKDTVEALRVSSAISQEVLEDMVFERYFQKSTLFGSLKTCLERARVFKQAGATELACMIDFGIPYEQTMASLGWLDRLRAVLATAGEAQS